MHPQKHQTPAIKFGMIKYARIQTAFQRKLIASFYGCHFYSSEKKEIEEKIKHTRKRKNKKNKKLLSMVEKSFFKIPPPLPSSRKKKQILFFLKSLG